MKTLFIFLNSIVVIYALVLDHYEENEYHFYWEKGNNWMQLDSQHDITCYLQHTGNTFKPYANNIYIIPPSKQNDSSSVEPGTTSATRFKRNQLTTNLDIKKFTAEDEGDYQCIWERNGKVTIIEKYINLMEGPAKIEVLERKPNTETVRVKEGQEFFLSATIAVYPNEETGYHVLWSREYDSVTAKSNISERIPDDEYRFITSEKKFTGHIVEGLKVVGDAVTTRKSGRYVLTIFHMKNIERVTWDVEIESEEPEIHIFVEGQKFPIADTYFYYHQEEVKIGCYSTAIPKSDVIIEVSNLGDDNFTTIGKNNKHQLTTLSGTFESGYLWTKTLVNHTVVTCSSTMNGKTKQVTKTLLLAEGALNIHIATGTNDHMDVGGTLQLYEGEDMQLLCAVPDFHNWTSYWLHDDQPIESEIEYDGVTRNMDVILVNISSTNSGNYKCVVKHGKAEEFREVNLVIDKLVKPFVASETNKNVTVEYDKEFFLDCGISGTPFPKYTWLKDGNVPIHGDAEDGSYKVHRARKEDIGNFKCVAKNRAGTAEAEFSVNVVNIPKKGLTSKKMIVMVLGAIVLFGLLIGFLAWINAVKAIKQKYLKMIIGHRQNSNQNSTSEEICLVSQQTSFEWNISQENLKIENPLGEGRFGKVFKGFLRMAKPQTELEGRAQLPVAVKSANNIYSVVEQEILWDELRVMQGIGKHPNVIALIGFTLSNRLLSIVIEFMECGNLKTYLKHHKSWSSFDSESESENNLYAEYVNKGYLVPNSLKLKKKLSETDLVSFSMQIANGMMYIASIPCVHRDLAIRNILINSNGIIRISDFGLARTHPDKEYYREVINKTALKPVRWMAPESIGEENLFTHKSDVWSFGICLYEIFSFGRFPYAKQKCEDVQQHILDGGINEQPELCPQEIYDNLMTKCWEMDPEDRPSFSSCFSILKEYLSVKSNETLERVEELLIFESEKQERLSNWV